MLATHEAIVQEAGWAVDIGARREKNEDSAAAINAGLIDHDGIQTAGIYVVADGVGGHSGGEVASSIAVNTVTQSLMQQLTGSEITLPVTYPQWLESAVNTANQIIFCEDGRMGTTIVAAIVIGNQAYIASVGDSRAYMLAPDNIYQITEDQSIVRELLKAGMITEEEAEKHPKRNVLTQALGISSHVEVDLYRASLELGSYLLLCSDGLTNELDNTTIHNVVYSSPTPQEACDMLVYEANESGGRDNISVVLVQVKPK